MFPLRPMVSSRDLVMYGVANVIACILKPLVVRLHHHVHNTQHFIEQIKDITLGPRECITSCDVTTLFISVPVYIALKIVHKN